MRVCVYCLDVRDDVFMSNSGSERLDACDALSLTAVHARLPAVAVAIGDIKALFRTDVLLSS